MIRQLSVFGIALLVLSTCARIAVADEAQNADLPDPVILSQHTIAGGPEKTNVLAMSFSPDGKVIVSGGRGAKALRFWEASTGNEIAAVDVPGNVTRFILFSADGSKLLTFGAEVGGECVV